MDGLYPGASFLKRKEKKGETMCGICGFVSKQNITLEQLTEMNDTMYHRGPDDSGVEIYPVRGGYALGLAQRRLSILDLSSMGHQPMHSPDKRVTVVYNGEIYNYPELKEELSDYPFCSSCDTEVILAAYLKWGIEGIQKLNGMFAIALFDQEKQELYLVRDRIGKKPLYYWYEAGNIVFASELKPIMKCPGFLGDIYTQILGRYLYQKCINAPDTIFRNVYKVEPGEIVTFFQGSLQHSKYWNLSKVYHQKRDESIWKNDQEDYEKACARLKELLKESVRRRMLSDVPLGSFLSGGYDSTLITALAKECCEGTLKTFSIGFYDKTYNEAEYAKEIAKYLGTEHTELYVDEADMFRLLESIPKYYDEPFSDSSQIPMMLVCELAKKDVTVALSGDGGDEFFCGYNVYDRIRQAQLLDGIGALTGAVTERLGITDRLPFKMRVIAGNRNPEAKTQLIAGNYLQIAQNMISEERREGSVPCYYNYETRYGEKNWQERRMLLDMETYLPGDILCKVDRASMKYSLEARCPILDRDVMEFAFGLPHEFKYQKGNKKRILKDVLYEYVPRELLERPKKGFSVPLDSWLRGPLKEWVFSVSEPGYLKTQGLFEPEYVYGFIQDYMEQGDLGAGTGANYSGLVWSFFLFQQWYQTYLAS